MLSGREGNKFLGLYQYNRILFIDMTVADLEIEESIQFRQRKYN
ncbi:hypothetical protein AB1I62_09290 [Enterococcus sp. AN402]